MIVPLSSLVPPDDEDDEDAPDEPDDVLSELDAPEQAKRKTAQATVGAVRERMPMGYLFLPKRVKNGVPSHLQARGIAAHITPASR